MVDIFEVRRIEDVHLWDRFVKIAFGGTVFSSSSWLRCASEAVGGNPLMLGCYRNEKLVGGCGLLEVRRFGVSKATTPPLTPYSGFMYLRDGSLKRVTMEAESERISGSLIEKLESDYGYIQISHAPDVVDIRYFQWKDWRTSLRYTYLIDIGELEALWESFEGRTRNAINKAKKGGFRVRGTDEIDLFLKLYGMVYSKQHAVTPLGADAIRKFYSSARKSGLCQMYLVESPSGEPASSVVFVFGFDSLYAWIGGGDPAFNASGANSLLYWKVFEATSGIFPVFDFIGANIPSIAKFKRGFGGRLTPYYCNEKSTSTLARVAIKTSPLLKRFLGRTSGR